MICKVREVEGGYKVTLLTGDETIDSRTTDDLAEAFAWQAHVSEHGELPPYKRERKK